VLGKESIAKVLNEAIEYGLDMGASQVEASAATRKAYLTRYAMNYINHNTGSEVSTVRVRVILDNKTGIATVGSLKLADVRNAVEGAITLAKSADPDPSFKGLPLSAPLYWRDAWSKETRDLSPDERAEIVAGIVLEAKRNGLEAAGIIANEEYELGVNNSLGTRSYCQGTKYSFTVTAMSNSSSGYARSDGWDVKSLDWRHEMTEAVEKCLASQNPIEVEPGEYEVVLEPNAVAVLFGFFARLALSGRAYEEGRSLVSGRLGERLLSDKLTIWDDGFDLNGLPQPFDIEGVPKKYLELVKEGRVINVCYDSYTAGLRQGLRSTGHAAPFDTYESGPFPVNLFVKPGVSTLKDMISDTKRGLWISRFHYTNAIDPYRVVITGMTRDAMFFIENGKIVAPVKPLRFTQDVPQALRDIEALGDKIKYIGGFRGGQAVPAVKINKFCFTGAV